MCLPSWKYSKQVKNKIQKFICFHKNARVSIFQVSYFLFYIPKIIPKHFLILSSPRIESSQLSISWSHTEIANIYHSFDKNSAFIIPVSNSFDHTNVFQRKIQHLTLQKKHFPDVHNGRWAERVFICLGYKSNICLKLEK